MGLNTNSSSIINCYSSGSVQGTQYLGGLTGSNNNSTIEQSYSTGSVTGTNNYAGGLLGYNSSYRVENSYCTGSVSGNMYVGGLVGANYDLVYHCYSTAGVSGNSSVGGLVGLSGTGAAATNSFWDTVTSGQTGSSGGVGKTTTEMKTLSTFTDAGWDFEVETTNGTNDYWDMDNSESINSGYPFLSWQNGEDVSLPVELALFVAEVTVRNTVRLRWITESEVCNQGFILERQQVGTNANPHPWTEIASFTTHSELRGQGSVSHRTKYTFLDQTVHVYQTYNYRLSDVDTRGGKVYHDAQQIRVTVDPGEPITIFNAYPNPFNAQTTLHYHLSVESSVRLTVYDIHGHAVQDLVHGSKPPGRHSARWTGTDNRGQVVSTGIYFFRIRAGTHQYTEKILYLK